MSNILFDLTFPVIEIYQFVIKVKNKILNISEFLRKIKNLFWKLILEFFEKIYIFNKWQIMYEIKLIKNE